MTPRPPRLAGRPAFAWLVAATLAAGCLAPVPALYPPASPEAARPVFVVQHGWHTRIAVRRADVSRHLWPESEDLGDETFIEVGWGDAAFYQADEPTIAQALHAVFRPTPAALHVGAFSGSLRAFLPHHPIVQVDVSPRGFDRLTTFIHDSYARDARGRAIHIGPGRYPRSAFYRATGRYHAFRTSNTWTASALRAAGTPVTPPWAVFAWGVMFQAERIGAALPSVAPTLLPSRGAGGGDVASRTPL